MKPKPSLLLLKTAGSLLLLNFLFSSCVYYRDTTISADYSKQKQGSSGGSSQSTSPVYGLNAETGWEFTPLEIKFPDHQSDFVSDDGSPFYTADRSFLSGLRIRTAIGFVQRGGQIGSGDDKVVNRFNYIKLPVTLRYGQQLANDVQWSAGLGPYFAYGIGGQTKVTSGGQTFKTKVFDGGGYKRFDAGLTIGGKYILPSGLVVGLDYDLGLANILKANGVSVKNRTVALEVGYDLSKLFGKTQKK